MVRIRYFPNPPGDDTARQTGGFYGVVGRMTHVPAPHNYNCFLLGLGLLLGLGMSMGMSMSMDTSRNGSLPSVVPRYGKRRGILPGSPYSYTLS